MASKGNLIVKLVVLLLVLAMLVAVFFIIIKTDFSGLISFGTSNELIETRSFTGVTDVVLSGSSGSVTVEEHDGNETVYEYYSTSSKNPPQIEQSGGTLTISQSVETRLLSFSRNNIIIRIPKGQALSYRLSSMSGSITMKVKSTDSELSTVSGSIKVYNGGRSLTADSTSGSIKVFEAFEHVAASSVSGSIKICANDITSSVSAETVSGSVKVMLPPSAGYELSYSTTSGSVKDEYRDRSFDKEGSASFGSDGTNVKIHASTVSGSIRLCDFDTN